jgi:hypothetical protein
MAWAPGKALRLATDKYVMRSMRPFQIDDYVYNWIMDRELTNYSGLPRFPSRQAVELWLKRFDNKYRFLLNITCLETDRVIGLQKLEYYPGTESAKADVVIGDREYWGVMSCWRRGIRSSTLPFTGCAATRFMER